MKRKVFSLVLMAVVLLSISCSMQEKQINIAATTMPVYTFTQALCQGTPLSVGLLVQENVSCLHDYSLTVKHMKILESAELIVISGGGLESFLEDALPENKVFIDASAGISLLCTESTDIHDHGHHHDTDPHFWLSIDSAKKMAHTVCNGLKNLYPQYSKQFDQNLITLDKSFDELQQHAKSQLSNLHCRELITFHDGFSYMAEEFGLTILHSIEEESGSEASARDLISICNLVSTHSLPAVFVEKNGSSSAATVISAETGVKVFTLDMAISGSNYFDAMYYNINMLKEALG